MKRINSLREERKFRQFENRVWKEVELAQRLGIHFEPYGDTVKPAASVDESSPSVPSSANSGIREN
jgi:hypothetical protein